MPLTRRQFILRGAAASAAAAAGAGLAMAQTAPRIIKVSAKRFEFTPNEIKLKLNEPVVFEVTTEDVLMGFNIPDFNARADIVPGKTQTLRLVPDRAGEFDFLCDIFCGTKHEEMSGKIFVA
jgi:cytochrome c oxidase subunit II